VSEESESPAREPEQAPTDSTSSDPTPDDPPPWQPPPPYGAPPGWQQPPPRYAAPPGWQQPPPPPYGAPPGWQPQPPPYGAPPGWQPGPPQYGAPPGSAPTGWHSVGGYPQPYGYPRPRNTNGFSIASLVLSLLGLFPLVVIGPVLGIIFGVIALRNPAVANRTDGGRGLAIAGIVIGVVVLLLDIIGLVAIATGSSNSGSSSGFTT
jgi:hypothetical protein